ncbi:MAG: endonuclease/exonuclease/phosphatase family protein [Nitrospirota bacterium]|jgi:endonuclease/exonuclease/phosphatase family metal-dependent hydrolase
MKRKLTVMTYNVHSCVGRDGKASPLRVAEVIARHSPDIVALQELDNGLVRTGGVDQTSIIAGALEMDYHFHPSLRIEKGLYGNAVLSALPARLVKAGRLPTHPGRQFLEQRGALWVEVDAGGVKVQVVNTHMGLDRHERKAQARHLAGPEWLGAPGCRPPVIFLGDLNTWSVSSVYRTFRRILRDAQNVTDAKPKRTYPSRLPLFRLDYIFVSDDIRVERTEVPRDGPAGAASDHLPVVCTVLVAGAEEVST